MKEETMIKKHRFKKALLSLLLILLLLSSCSAGSGDNNGNENGGEEMNGRETLYDKSCEIMLIPSQDPGSRAAAHSLAKALNDGILDTGRAFVGNLYIDGNYPYQIIMGYVPEREASVEAYRLLSEMPTPDSVSDARCLIYADSGTVAFAYDTNESSSYQPVERIVEDFVSGYVTGKEQISLEHGVVMTTTYDVNALQAEADRRRSEEMWEVLSQVIEDKDVVSSLRAFFENMFDDRVMTLIGNLYDPASGLFYASTSGKRAEGIYPNPEASNQALGYLESVLDIPGKLKDYLPDIVGYKIIYYVKSIQDEDGDFYIPQIKKNDILPNRLGGDRSSCLGLLSRFGGAPTYSVGSVKGDGITAEQYWASLVAEGLVTDGEKPIIYWADLDRRTGTASLSASKESMVSSAVSASEAVTVSATAPFMSHESFVVWLLERDGYNDPYTAMSNTLSSGSLISDFSKKLGGYEGENKTVTAHGRSYEIKTGETLYDILINWTNSYINDAGLFGKITENYVKDENGKYDLVAGKYVLADDGDGEYSPVLDGFYGGWGYQNSNGFHKAIARYSNIGMAFPKPREAAESLLKGINSDEPIGSNILVILNVWTSLGALRTNVERYYTGEDKYEILYMIEDTLWSKITDDRTGETRTYAALAIDKCLSKLLTFKKSDGGFGHSATAGTAGWQGNLPVGIASDNLSDMNAIACTASELGKRICTVLGFDMKLVPLHMEADLKLFLDAFNSQPYVVKTLPITVPDGKPAEKETFDAQSGWVKYGMGNGSSYELTKLSGESVLHISKNIGSSYFVYEGVGIADENATVTVIGMRLLIDNLTEYSGIEIYPRISGNNVFLPYLSISGAVAGSAVTVYDHSSGEPAVDSGIRVGEWAALEIRYYPEQKKYDLYVNEEYVMSGSYLRYGTEYPSASEIDGVLVGINNKNVGDFYFDDVYVWQINEGKD